MAYPRFIIIVAYITFCILSILALGGCASKPKQPPSNDQIIAQLHNESKFWDDKLMQAEEVMLSLPMDDPLRRLWEKRAARAMAERDRIAAYIRLLLILAEPRAPSTQPSE